MVYDKWEPFLHYCLVFRNETNSKVLLQGSELNRVVSCENLSVIFSSDLTCDLTIDRATNAFIKQFSGL